MSMLDSLLFNARQREQQLAKEQARRAAAEGAEALRQAREQLLAVEMQKPPVVPVEAPTVAPVPLPPAIPDTPIAGDGLRIQLDGDSVLARARVRADAHHSRAIDELRVQKAASECASQTASMENKQAYGVMLAMLKARGLRGRELIIAKTLAWELRQRLLGKLTG
jgi:hypothetical protein